MSAKQDTRFLDDFEEATPYHFARFADYANRASDEIAQAMQNRALRLDTEREAIDADCGWEEDCEGAYETGCNRRFVFIDGNFDDNGFLFCPYCGGRITHHIHETGTDE